MRQKLPRRVPNTISKRLRRKLSRSKNPYLLWIRCRQKAIYARLVRYWEVRFWSLVTTIDPIDTPIFSLAPRVEMRAVLHTWVTDKLIPVEEP